MSKDEISILVVLVAFAPMALQRLAPETQTQRGLYHLLAIGQIAASIALFVALPLRDFLIYWAILPAAFGAWHFWRVAKTRHEIPADHPAPGE